MINYPDHWGVVTGGSSGFGELFAQRLAGRGAREVACPDRAQPEPDRGSRGAHPDAIRVDTAPAGLAP